MTTVGLAVGERLPLELVDGKAPTELRLFRAGKNPSTKGDFLFDQKAAKAVMAEFRRMGRSWVSIDYDHGQLQKSPVDPSASGKSAGRASLEVRDGELWATNIRWTPAAQAAIEAGEWPAISPAFAHSDDGRPTWLINFAITGNPSLHSPAELIAANILIGLLGPSNEEEAAIAELRAVPFAEHSTVDGAWDANAAVQRLRKWASSDGSGDTDKMDWGKYSQGFTIVDGPAENFGSYKLPHHDVVDGKLVDAKRGVYAAASVIQGGRGGVNMPAGDEAAVKAHIAKHYAQWDDKAPWEQKTKTNVVGDEPTATVGATEELNAMKKKSAAEIAEFFGMSEDEAKAMIGRIYGMMDKESVKANVLTSAVALSIGLAADAAEPMVVERLSALSAFERDVFKSLGKQDRAEALGALSGLVANEENAKKAIVERDEMRSAQARASVETLLSAAKAEKKLTPAEFDDASESGLRATALSMGDKAEKWLKEHLAKRVPIAALTTDFKQPKTEPEQAGEKKPVAAAEGKKYAELSYMEKDELSRNNPPAFEKLRTEWLNSKPKSPTFPMGDQQNGGGIFRDLPSN